MQYRQYMNKVDMLSRCCECAPPIPFKTQRSTYQPIWNLESLLCFSPRCPLQKHYVHRSTYKTTWHHEPCLRMFKVSFEYMNKMKCNHYYIIFVNSFSYSKPICSTCEEHWHLEPFWNLPPTTLQSNRFSIWRKLTCWVIVVDLTPVPCNKNNTVNIWTTFAFKIIFWNVICFDPTKPWSNLLGNLTCRCYRFNPFSYKNVIFSTWTTSASWVMLNISFHPYRTMRWVIFNIYHPFDYKTICSTYFNMSPPKQYKTICWAHDKN